MEIRQEALREAFVRYATDASEEVLQDLKFSLCSFVDLMRGGKHDGEQTVLSVKNIAARAGTASGKAGLGASVESRRELGLHRPVYLTLLSSGIVPPKRL